jgi:MFS family permease
MQVLSVSVGWQVYEITRDPLALGFVGLAQFGPMFALTLYAGDVADRYERRIVLALAHFVSCLCGILFFCLSYWNVTNTDFFYAVLVLFGIARAFSGPTGQALLPQLVMEKDLPQAIAWSSSTFQVAVISGPALGGAALAWGATFAYGLSASLFAIVVVGLFAIRVTTPKHAASDVPALERLLAGIAYVRNKRILFGAISLDLFAVLLGGATGLLPIYAKDILHVGPDGLGWLRAGPAIGAAGMSVALGFMPQMRHAGWKMFLSVAAFGVATILFGISESFFISLAALIVLGATDMISVNVRHSLTQLTTPDHMRGRVSAVSMLFIGASNELGEFESGVTARWWGTVPAVVIGGLGTLGIVALWAYWFPELRKVDRLTELKAD